MSILNVWIAREFALVGVDTAGQSPDSTLWHDVSKMFFLPAVGCVLAARGDSSFVDLLHSRLNSKGDYDDLAAIFLAEAKKLFFWWGVFSRCAVQEIVLVGYSEKGRRMAGCSCIRTDRKTGFIVKDINPSYLAPWDESLQHISDPQTPADLANFAVMQLKMVRDKKIAGAIGGRFVIAELNQRGMQIWRGVPLE